MMSSLLRRVISAVFVVAAGVLLCVLAPFATAQNPGSPDAQAPEAPQLDYEFFKTRVEPIFPQLPLAEEAGVLADTHQGGSQFASEDDPNWKNMREWVLGQKAGSSSAP